ncbi:hypothetical protein D0T56_05860 [Dysgonomonas sp. 520]|nr:hypothetical protein [Dysgonomonas sp. 520]
MSNSKTKCQIPCLLLEFRKITFEFLENTRKKNALSNDANKKAGTLITTMRNSGSKWSEIVLQLNQNGFRTRRGCNFDITAVKRLYERYSSNFFN